MALKFLALRDPLVRRSNVLFRRHNTNPSYQPPSPEQPKSNPHRDFYKTLGRPVAQNFLIALATFQVLYWSWLKLESMEVKQDTRAEIEKLEGELKGLPSKE